MGKKSIVKLPVKGKVNSSKEIILNAFATAVDLLDRKLLTHYKSRTIPALYQVVNGRFLVLKRLARNKSKSAYNVVANLHKTAILFLQKKINAKEYLKKIKQIVNKHLTVSEINMVFRKVH